MAKLLFLIYLIGMGHFSKAQITNDTYFVTIVKGKVSGKDHHPIIPGSKLSTNDIVLFGTANDLLILLHPSKGRFIVSPTAIAKGKSEIETLIRNSLHYFVSDVRLSSRALEANGAVRDYFDVNAAINKRILIIDELKIPLQRSGYRDIDNKDVFFFLQVDDENAKNRKLLVIKDSLQIKLDDIELGQSDSTQLTLAFVRNFSTNRNVEIIGSFLPVYLTRIKALEIMQAIHDSMRHKKKAEIMEEIYGQLYHFYGKPNMADIEKLYQKLTT